MLLFLQTKLDRLREPYDRKHCDAYEKEKAFGKANSKLDKFTQDHLHDPVYAAAVNDMVAWKGRGAGIQGPAVVGRETDCEATSPMSHECEELKLKVCALRAVGGGGGDWLSWL